MNTERKPRRLSNRRIRTLHRWASLLFAAAVIPALIFTSDPESSTGVLAAAWGIALGVGLISMLITGLTLQFSHFRARRRLDRRLDKAADAPAASN